MQFQHKYEQNLLFGCRELRGGEKFSITRQKFSITRAAATFPSKVFPLQATFAMLVDGAPMEVCAKCEGGRCSGCGERPVQSWAE